VQEKQKELVTLVKKERLEKLKKEMEEDEKRVKAFQEWDDTRVNGSTRCTIWRAIPFTDKTRLEQFRAEPLTPQKNAKIKYVARLFLKVSTDDGRQMDALQSAIQADKKYHNVVRQTKGGVVAGSKSFSQSYELRTDIEKRPTNEYIRKLTAAVPPKPGKGKEDTGDEFDEAPATGGGFPNLGAGGGNGGFGMGGGFGGNPGGFGGNRVVLAVRAGSAARYFGGRKGGGE
jgi:hypothetical protein